MENGTTINLFGNPNMITNRQKVEIPMNFLTTAGSKVVYKVGEITGAGQTKLYSEIIANNMSLNEMTKKCKVTIDSGKENAFRVKVGDNIFKFTDNYDRLYLRKPDKIFGEVTRDNKRNMIE